jgi:hypothetical protein
MACPLAREREGTAAHPEVLGNPERVEVAVADVELDHHVLPVERGKARARAPADQAGQGVAADRDRLVGAVTRQGGACVRVEQLDLDVAPPPPASR